jgi:hypothetical protein
MVRSVALGVQTQKIGSDLDLRLPIPGSWILARLETIYLVLPAGDDVGLSRDRRWKEKKHAESRDEKPIAKMTTLELWTPRTWEELVSRGGTKELLLDSSYLLELRHRHWCVAKLKLFLDVSESPFQPCFYRYIGDLCPTWIKKIHPQCTIFYCATTFPTIPGRLL